jgi:hypothetical protein
MMNSLKLVASATLAAAFFCVTYSAVGADAASVVNSAVVATRPGGLSVTPNLRIYGNKPPMPPRGGKVTPPDKPPVVYQVSPGVPDKDNEETGHGQRRGQNLRKFTRADGTFYRN